MTLSPYVGITADNWAKKTRELLDSHPLKADEIVDVVLRSWEGIFESGFGKKPFKIGVDIFPKPQILGFLLHELIPLELASRHPRLWRGEETAADKDIVYKPDQTLSVEIKSSSHRTQIFGNRSYTQETTGVTKKNKSGYYLAINFEKCTKGKTTCPAILRIRFGWLDHSDWAGQKAASGQQARLSPEVERGKLIQIFPKT